MNKITSRQSCVLTIGTDETLARIILPDGTSSFAVLSTAPKIGDEIVGAINGYKVYAIDGHRVLVS